MSELLREKNVLIEVIPKKEIIKVVEEQLAEINKGQRKCVDQCKLNVLAIGYKIEKLPVILISEKGEQSE